MSTSPIVIDLDDEEDYVPPHTGSGSIPNSRQSHPVMAHIPDSISQAQQMPPPSRPMNSGFNAIPTSQVNVNRLNNTQTQFIQSVTNTNCGRSSQPISNTTVNVIICSSSVQNQTTTKSNLWNVPAFSKRDDETSSVQFLGEVPRKPRFRQPVRQETSENPAPIASTSSTTANDGINPTSTNPFFLNMRTQQQFSSNSPMTPPPSPAHISTSRLSVSSDQSNDEGLEEAVRSGKKRTAPMDEIATGILSSPKRRIAPIPVETPKIKEAIVPAPAVASSSSSSSNSKVQPPNNFSAVTMEARILVEKCTEAEAKLKNVLSAKAVPSKSTSSLNQGQSPVESVTEHETLLKELGSAESVLMASIGVYVHEKLSRKYNLSQPENIRKAIKTLKDVNRYMQPGKNRLRETFRFLEIIDHGGYEEEVERLIQKREQYKEQRKKEDELAVIVQELEGYENRLKALDEKSIFETLSAIDKSEKSLIAASLVERYAAYEKLRGVGNEVFMSLHRHKFEKVHLQQVTQYPEINDAVEKFLDARRIELFKGFHPDGWDELIPTPQEMLEVVKNTAAAHNIMGTNEHFKEISAVLYDVMVKQVQKGRGLDYLDNFDVWADCSKEKVTQLLAKDPVKASAGLPIMLETNTTTASHNMNLHCIQFEDRCARANKNKDKDAGAETEDISGDVSDNDDEVEPYDARLDVETDFDRQFIDDSIVHDEVVSPTSSTLSSDTDTTLMFSSGVADDNEESVVSDYTSCHVPGAALPTYSSSTQRPITSTDYITQTYFNLKDLSASYEYDTD